MNNDPKGIPRVSTDGTEQTENVYLKSFLRLSISPVNECEPLDVTRANALGHFLQVSTDVIHVRCDTYCYSVVILTRCSGFCAILRDTMATGKYEYRDSRRGTGVADRRTQVRARAYIRRGN